MKTLLPGILLAALLSGCGTHHPKLVIGNAGDREITKVNVTADGKSIYHADVISPHTTADTVDIADSFAHQANIKWILSDSGAYEDAIPLQPDISVIYTGITYIQLSTNSAARVFYLSEEEFKESVLPWTTPEQWEETPRLPGVNQR